VAGGADVAERGGERQRVGSLFVAAEREVDDAGVDERLARARVGLRCDDVREGRERL
jgi:hypothetical protein